DCGDGAGVMGAVGTWTSWTGTGASTLAVARATGEPVTRGAAQASKARVSRSSCSTLCVAFDPVAGEAEAGRATTRSVRPTSTAKFIAMKLQAPWFSGSSWTQVSEASG